MIKFYDDNEQDKARQRATTPQHHTKNTAPERPP